MEDTSDYINKPVTEPHNIAAEGVIPVIKEHLVISTNKIVTAEVTVQKTVTRQEVDVPLQDVYTRYREVRMPVNRIVDTMPQTREENGTLIVPVVREEEVVVKRLVLVEEIHLIREVETNERSVAVTLNSETATVTRTDLS